MEPFIPLADPQITHAEIANVSDALSRNELSWRGDYVGRFEGALAKYLGSPTLTTSSGMGALMVALHSLGIRHGDEVIVPALTFPGVASAVLAVGATPVLCDISSQTWGLTIETVERAVTRKTAAIIQVHSYGLLAEDCSGLDVPVIEDACEAFGMVWPRVSSEYTVFSFYANKVITTGEGGAICGGDLSKAFAWRNGGFDEKYCCKVPGLNYRMGNLQAAVGLGQMDRVRELVGARLDNAKRYAQELPGKGRWLFCAQVPDPAAAEVALAIHNIESRRVFIPLHIQPAFWQRGPFPVAEWVWTNHIALPTGPHLTDDGFRRICRIIKGLAKGTRDGDHELCGAAGSGQQLAAPG